VHPVVVNLERLAGLLHDCIGVPVEIVQSGVKKLEQKIKS
jgi:hypothetical protein